ncbi:hypothetical protein SISSUDRAFT_1050602 [Sistotremastrum suecicum HHB10207 ss-3]|uniref:Mucoidy inhibitor A n=1 Tax=Sistotremastrum suecicum HHB10207 ss-3 TaxID=1314776 RepID=A0A166B2P3_9AGAM|nr:hypothetical protein SISSUDRAFT_1050602 [Sistotremastrum suecicum HHB10207 ss-3]
MANTVVYDASLNRISAVTVYQIDRAEINRKIRVDLKAGQNEVVVTGLPAVIDPDSVRADGIGRATILDVIFRAPSSELRAPTSTNSERQPALKALLRRKAQIQSEIHILGRQSTSLDDCAVSIREKDLQLAKIDEFFEFHRARKRALDDEAFDLHEKLQECEQEVESLKALDAPDPADETPKAQIVINANAQETGPVEFDLSYVVSSAQWVPLYDIRASISDSPKSGSSISCHYRASISQSTGENWENTRLTLSTASPQVGTSIPALKPHRLGEEPPPVRHFTAFGAVPTRSRPMLQQQQGPPGGLFRGPEPEVERSAPSPPPPPFMATNQAASTQGAVSATFAIEGLSSIPSGEDDDAQTHKVTIATLTFENVTLEWVSIPRELPSVFLQCRVRNTSGYLLLPGVANIFLDDSFAAKSQIPQVSPAEAFSLSLGVDPQVRVIYHPLRKTVKASGGILTTKTSSSSFAQVISLKNGRKTAIPKLVVKEVAPVSNDERIKVSILEPKGLSEAYDAKSTATSSKEVTVASDVKVRWAPLGGTGDIDEGNIEGTVHWTCSLAAGASQDLNLCWDVNVPVGLKWVRL